MTAAVMGAKVKPIPNPVKTSDGKSDHGVASRVDSRVIQKMPITITSRPPNRIQRVPIRSLKRPEKGAATRIVNDIGDIASPALMAE